MKKIAILIILVAAFSSCGIDYDGEKRLVFETRVLGKDNLPIAHEHVKIQVLNGETDTPTGDLSNIISNGVTDSDGFIRLIFPAPDVATNTIKVVYDGNEDYLERHISNIKMSDFDNYKLIFPTVQLFSQDDLVTLSIATENTSGTASEIADITVDGNRAYEQFNYVTQAPFPDYYAYSNLFFFKNQQVTVNYTVYDTTVNPPTATQHHDVITIGNEPLTYTINY